MTAFGLPGPGEITGVIVQAKPGAGYVLLDRIDPAVPAQDLPYCTHGRVSCVGCQEWCWLGHKTHDVVASGEAAPLCLECAHRLIPKGAKPTHHIEDHLRADGPH